MSDKLDQGTTSLYGPVNDWATDFDHADPEYNPNAHEIWAESLSEAETDSAQISGGRRRLVD